MLALKINDVKNFMNHLLAGTEFDSFYLSEATFTTYCRFSIDGELQKDFYDTDTADQLTSDHITYASWQTIRPHCFSIIKGKLPPVRFKIVLTLKPSQLPLSMGEAPISFVREHVNALFLNIHYHDKELFVTTGISTESFTLSKEPDGDWAELAMNFLKTSGFDFEEQ